MAGGRRKRFADLRLGIKILALFLLISVLPLVLSASYVVGYLATSSAMKARADLADCLAKAEIVIDKRLAEIERFAKAASRDNLVTINLELLLEAPVRGFLEGSLETQSLDYLGVVDAEARVRVDGGRGSGLRDLVAAIGAPAFRRSIGAGSLRFAASLPAANRLVLGAIAPILDDSSALMGYIVAGDELRSGGDGASRGFLAEIRRAVGIPVLVVSGGKLSAFSEGPLARGTIAPLESLGFSTVADLGRLRVAIDGESFLFQFRALFGSGDSRAGLLGLGLREADFMAARNRSLYGFLLFFVLALGMSALIALLFSRSLTRPIESMLRGTRLIVQGNFDTVIPLPSRDEIGILSEEFNRMSARLGATLKALRDEVSERVRAQAEVQKLNAELEARIAERSARLVEAEKMAALGQLVASIAHEINTPLGAIISSNEGIAENLAAILGEAPSLAALLGPEERAAFDFLVATALRPRPVEEPLEGDRGQRKSFAEALEAAGVADPRGTADDFVEMGLVDPSPSIMGALAGDQGPRILASVRRVFWIVRAHDIIAFASDKAAATIRALKNYAYVDSGSERSEFSLQTEIDSLLALYYGKMRLGVELRREYGQVPPLVGRRDLLNQVWINLINNALQAMEYRGVLEIRIFSTPDGGVGVSFTDDGPGLPEEYRDSVFKPFFTTKRQGEGSGLGLSICKKIVEEQGGSIGFESVPGRTVFTVLLPLGA